MIKKYFELLLTTAIFGLVLTMVVRSCEQETMEERFEVRSEINNKILNLKDRITDLELVIESNNMVDEKILKEKEGNKQR